jgi:hypothetical protein
MSDLSDSKPDTPTQQAFFDDGWSDPIFQSALKGGNLAGIYSVAIRRALAAIPGDLDHPAIAVLRAVCPDPPEDYDPRPYIRANHWVFAVTAAATHPHEYLMLRSSSDWREHLRFLRWVRRGQREKWLDGRIYPYRLVDEWRYWALGSNDSILNRERRP